MENKAKKNDKFDPADLKPEDMMKFEIATELGLADKVINGGWRSLTAKESGRIGGLITKRKREMKKEVLKDNNGSHIMDIEIIYTNFDSAGERPKRNGEK